MIKLLASLLMLSRMGKYDHSKIEKKWQERWAREKLHEAREDSSKKEKRYILDMFPYPSGDGLHVGHVEGYTATDIYSRFKRMQGFAVLHPMGWDAFGLPAENYAVKTGIHPRETTAKAIGNFTRQIESLGLSYDWGREIGSHTPEYYKWTQWFFLLLYKNGLAYKKEAPINWDPKDQTVLANEQVLPDGTAERSGAKVEKRMMSQWFFKTTEYADALFDDLDTVDWPESTVTNQRNWIGRSQGAVLRFPISNSQFSIDVFTTRPDTLFGATYMVVAPEHDIISNLKSQISNLSEVEDYIEKAKAKTDIERTAENKEKTGVELKGIKAINPGNKEEIPIFAADYVLAHYGTGAIMAVPAHDDRDLQFSLKFGLPICPVIAQVKSKNEIVPGLTEVKIQSIKESGFAHLGDGFVFNSGEFDGLTNEEAKQKITEAVGGELKTTYKLRDWLISRQRYWGAPIPIVYDPEGNSHPVPEEHLPWLLPDDVDFMPKGYAPLSRSKALLERTEKIFGKGWKPEVDTMDTFVCSSWYFFRFADPHNENAFASKEQLEKWMPVDLYMGGAEHTVLHLLYARFFTKVLKTLGLVSFNEPFRKLRHQGMMLAEDGRKMSKSLGNVINPNDVVAAYGADTVRMYEMFMGPLEDMKPWNTDNIIGARRFIEKVWRLLERIGEHSDAVETVLHQTIRKVGNDIEHLKYNTAISQMMIFLNAVDRAGSLSKEQMGLFVKVLAPFAPHVAEELWEKLGHTESIQKEAWPEYDTALIAGAEVTIAVQVDGKVRGEFTASRGLSKEEALEKARNLDVVKKWLNEAEIRDSFYVQDCLINIVLKKL